MKKDNPYLLAQPGFEPTPSLGLSIHIKKDLNAKATEPRRLHRFQEWKDNRSFILKFCLFFYWNHDLFGFVNFFLFHYNFFISTVLTTTSISIKDMTQMSILFLVTHLLRRSVLCEKCPWNAPNLHSKIHFRWSWCLNLACITMKFEAFYG